MVGGLTILEEVINKEREECGEVPYQKDDFSDTVRDFPNGLNLEFVPKQFNLAIRYLEETLERIHSCGGDTKGIKYFLLQMKETCTNVQMVQYSCPTHLARGTPSGFCFSPFSARIRAIHVWQKQGYTFHYQPRN